MVIAVEDVICSHISLVCISLYKFNFVVFEVTKASVLKISKFLKAFNLYSFGYLNHIKK
jgi:hypothetical protein